MTESFRSADGLTLRYHVRGEGPTLVCHPGGPGFSSRYFAGDLGTLDESFRLVLLDPRGTSSSERPADPTAYADEHYAADVEALRIHLGLEELNLFGHSHGGVVAIVYAASYPGALRRVAIVNSLVRMHPEEMEAIKSRHSDEPWYEDAQEALEREEAGDFADEEELRELALRELAFYFAHYDERARAYIDEHVAAERPNPDPLKVFNERIENGRFDLSPLLARVNVPALVLTGDSDFICGPACAQDIADGIPHAEKVILDDCGHFSFVEKPSEFRAQLERFLQ